MPDDLPALDPADDADLTPVERLEAAVRVFVNEVNDSDTPVLLDTAVLAWEQVRLDEDGDALRCVRYAVVTANGTLASSVGLLDLARDAVKAAVAEG